jgi:uncharacterized repeat protein (TIGR03803 family)
MTTATQSRQLNSGDKFRAIATLILFIGIAIGSQAQTFTALWTFSNQDGNQPQGTLILASDGNFYGTTYQGGNLNDCQLYGCGTVFRLIPPNVLTTIYAFKGTTDGSKPRAGVIEVNGVLYGTTSAGGGVNGTEQGTIFSVNLDGSNFKTLHTFTGGNDGGAPYAALLLGLDLNLYGTASQGGQGQNTTCVPNGCGTIFSIAPDGSKFNPLYQFTGGNDGSSPQAALIQDASGNFYSTAGNGGALCNSTLTCGTVFLFRSGPVSLTPLHAFNATTDGANPIAPLVRKSDGTLYGTARYGGNLNCGINVAGEGCGTIFQVSGTTFSVIHTFQGSQVNGDGAQPVAELIFGTDGNLYGTTSYGGTLAGSCTFDGGCGTVFSITPGRAPKILHSFAVTDGSQSEAGLVESGGLFYGTAAYGGNTDCNFPSGCGTAFSLTAPSSGKTSTSTAVIVTPSSIQQGSTSGVSLSATVTPASGSGTPTGSVAFFNKGTQVDKPAALSAGTAVLTYNTSALAAGAYSITGTYSGDPNFSPSTSSAATLTVTPAMFALTVAEAGTGTGTVMSRPSGISCPGTCSASFNSGIVVTLTAAAGSGSTFAGWSGACSGTATCGVTMSAAKSVAAAFNLSGHPAVTLSPTSLTFGTQAIGVSSIAKTVTLKNTGTASLSISGISTTGTNASDFAQTHTCGTFLGAGASCTISVTFKPTTSGCRGATVNVADNAAGSPQKVSLTGTGTTAKLSPTSLSLGTVAIGITSIAKTVTLKNAGIAALSLTGISITGTNAGDFSQTHTCGTSLSAGASCTISLTFKPAATGTRTASLSVADNASGSPQQVSLSGVGSTAKLSPTSLSFGSVTVGSTSTAKTVTLTNVGAAALSLTGISITGKNAGDFSQTHTCGTSLAAGKSCTISVDFKPSAKGARGAAVSVTDNASGSPQEVVLTGTGAS